MKKRIVKSIAAIVICLGLVCDWPALSVMAEEPVVSEICSEEETPLAEEAVPEEELPVSLQEDLSISVPEESEAEEIPEEDATESGTEEEFLGESGTHRPYPGATYELKYDLLENDTLKITGCSVDPSGELVIPDKIDGKPVTVIGDNAFYRCTGFVGSLIIPDSVTTIGAFAFRGCSGFEGSLTIGNSVRTIGNNAFTNSCRFTGDLIIPNSVTTIGDHAFEYCGRLSGDLIIPNSVKTIGSHAFSGCDHFTGDLIISNRMTTIEDHTFDNSGCFRGILIIPKSVTTIGDYAFNSCGDFRGDLIIPDSVKTIGDCAFNGFRVEGGSLKIGNSVTEIGKRAFYGCDDFTGSLIIPNSVKTIGEEAFYGCIEFNGGLTIGNSVETIGKKAFWGCTGLSGSLRIPDSVETVGEGVFASCIGLSGSLIIPDSVTTIGREAFRECRGFSGSLTIPDSVEIISEKAFYECSGFDGSLKIGDSVTEIRDDAFCDCCGFTGSLKIGESVTTIGEDAFNGCYGFTGSLTIPAGVTEIGEEAFDGCSGFRKVVNRTSYDFVLPSPDAQSADDWSWFNADTGISITSIANGTARRSDFYDTVEAPYFTHNEIKQQKYTGKAVRSVVEVYFGEKLLKEKKDYTIKYTNNKNAGLATFTITGKGSYTGKDTDSFKIEKKNIEDDDVFLTVPATANYTKKEQRPVPKITYNGIALKNGKDFRVTYYADEYYREYCIPKEPGTYYLKITGTGNFTGKGKTTFVIAESGQIPVSKLKIEKIAAQSYTGEQFKPEPVVKNGKTKLTENTHYKLTYGSNTEVGTGSVTITGIEPYVGERTVTFKIKGTPMNKVTVSGLRAVSYDGTEKTPAVTLTYKASKKAAAVPVTCATKEQYDSMSEDAQKAVNCILSYGPNTEAGTGTVILTGINGGSGTAKKTFKITPFDMTTNPDERITVSLAEESYPFAKGGAKPKPTVEFKEANNRIIPLTEGVDYTLSYRNNTAVNNGTGTKKPTVTVNGKGNFKGRATATFAITQADMKTTGVKVIVDDVVYQNKAGKWKAKIKVVGPDGKALKAGTDYESKFLYKDNKEIPAKAIPDAGTDVLVWVTAKGNSYTGWVTGEYRIVKQDISKLKASVAVKLYTAQAVEIAKGDITWKKGKKKVNDVTFTIDETSYRNNTNVSTKKSQASVKVKGTGNYGGTATVAFKIKKKSILWWWRELFN